MKESSPCFIDLFAGCGGFSLGFIQAGYRGVFAIEKSADAFDTLKFNLIESFDWPSWLPCRNLTMQDLLSSYPKELRRLEGKVDVIVGGPPCQGFSIAGKRDPSDPRNLLTNQYIDLVSIIKPKLIVIENVTGYAKKFKSHATSSLGNSVYAETVISNLTSLGYAVEAGMVCALDFGVPQNRRRFIIVAQRIPKNESLHQPFSILTALQNFAPEFKLMKGLNALKPVTIRQAIEDLRTSGKKLINCNDSAVSGFLQLDYVLPKKISPYVKAMRFGMKNCAVPDSLRLPKHKPDTKEKFRIIQDLCKGGEKLSKLHREMLGIKKHTLAVLNPEGQSPTVTTLPDDIIHYVEPRILTVREMARIQSFPDWYSIRGKYTTGGDRRKLECPRYTQIGNAVPPLLSEAIARVAKRFSLLIKAGSK